MKRKILKFAAIALLLAGTVIACNEKGNTDAENIGVEDIPKLQGTKWKLECIVNEQTGSIQTLEPTDCGQCYTLEFETDTTGTGYSTSNILSINLNRSPYLCTEIEIGEMGDGDLFFDILMLTARYEYDSENIKLKFFYRKEGKNYYLLFKNSVLIDMPDIDFSNIENLYAQPLPVIQKAVQGKWKVYQIALDGFWYNVSYPENLYIEFKDNYYVYWEYGGKPDTVYFAWKKTAIENWRNPLKGHITYVMWKGKPEDDYADNWYFYNILNDTLNFEGYMDPVYYRVAKVK
ncbi:MAG: hypothetical protein LBH32_14945 [Dysgonamonadaceae bacterium]|jgi:hypothetical protein|nr:hypothetical protein [Dysgonamonadaceae bacterium]